MLIFLEKSRILAFFCCILYLYVLYYTQKDKEVFLVGIVYQTDKRSGITYAYENQSFWDPELKRSKSKRKLIGRVDPETNEIIPTDGRCKKRSPSYVPNNEEYQMPKTVKELKEEVIRLLKENAELKRQLADIKK